MLYRVTVGQDHYIGSAVEVVDFLRKAEGAPPSNTRHEYMQAMADRVKTQLCVNDIDLSSAEDFLESLHARKVIKVSVGPEPSDERVDRDVAIGDGPIAYGPGVHPDDVD